MQKKTQYTTILLTASDYAKRHGISRVAVNNAIHEKRINAVRVGGVWLVEDTLRIK